MSKKSSNEDKAGKEGVKVSIMQREFTVACSREERQSVVEAAAYLDKQMRAVAKGTQVLGVDRCAIMAGLNISHELLQLQKRTINLKSKWPTDGPIVCLVISRRRTREFEPPNGPRAC